MSKKLMAIVAFIALVLMAFTACDSTNYGGGLSADTSASTVSSNGGFLAETGDYVYFINGNELYTADNTMGKVTKGALVRVKKSDFANLSEAKAEVVVSKVVSTSDYTAGIFISGGKIYFATPSADTDKKGEIQKDDVKFCYANLDGTGYTEFATSTGTKGNSVMYRFYEVDGKVYVAFATSETVTENGTESSRNFINIVAADGSSTFRDDYELYVMDRGTGSYIYYTKKIENEELDITESFNEVYRVKVGATATEKIFYGAGSNRNVQDNKQYSEKKGSAGVNFAPVAANNGYFYFSVSNVDTSTGSVIYFAYVSENVNSDPEINFANLYDTDEANGDIMTFNGDSENILKATSIFESPESIVYVDPTNGICKYNYKNSSSYEDCFGISVEYYSKDIVNATISYVDNHNGYLYFQLSGVYYRLPYNAGDITDGAKEQRVTPAAFSSNWYVPEMVTIGEKEYFVGTLYTTDFFDYVFAFEVEDEEAYEASVLDNASLKSFIEGCYVDEDEIEEVLDGYQDKTYAQFLSEMTRESVLYLWQDSVSFITDENMQEVNDYIDTTYPVEDDDSSSDEADGCSSAMGGTAMLGGAIVLMAGAFVSKKRS